MRTNNSDVVFFICFMGINFNVNDFFCVFPDTFFSALLFRLRFFGSNSFCLDDIIQIN